MIKTGCMVFLGVFVYAASHHIDPRDHVPKQWPRPGPKPGPKSDRQKRQIEGYTFEGIPIEGIRPNIIPKSLSCMSYSINPY